jgi:hypothetical protein
VRLLFGPFEPDKPPFLSQSLITASNVYPGALGYRPVGQFEPLTSGTASKPLGAASFVSPAGITTIVAGTQDALYRLELSGWTLLAGGFSLVDDIRWRFAQFGGLAIATNGSDPLKKIDLTTFATANLGGSPPTMKMLTVVKDFLVGGSVGGVVNKVQWSAINNAEGWTIGLEQADYQIIPSGGEVTGLLGGEFGLILQRGRVSRMTYVGDNLVFQFDEISNNVGCVSPHSVVQAGQMGFWLSDNGFVMWDGATIKPIGQERVDRTFSASYTRGSWVKMSTAVDVSNNLVVWAMGDRMFVYNWVLDRWSIIDQPAAIVFSGYSRTFGLEDIASLYPVLELVPYSLDDPRWKGGDPKFFVFDASFRLGNFSGTPMAATLGTGDNEIVGGRDARITFVRPLGDAIDGVSIDIACRARLGDTLTANTYSGLTSSGDVPVRESGRYVRLTQEFAAGTDWTYAQGIDLVPHKGAKR